MNRPQRFKKRPEITEAMQYTGTNSMEVGWFVGAHNTNSKGQFMLFSINGLWPVTAGDWIIKLPQGGFSTMRPKEFVLQYTEVATR